jgi:hypothetical protein
MAGLFCVRVAFWGGPGGIDTPLEYRTGSNDLRHYSPDLFGGRGERIRTSDLSVPNAALYQAEPRPDNMGTLVPKVGVEPTWSCPQRFLRPSRLPFRHFGNTWGIIAEPVYKVKPAASDK